MKSIIRKTIYASLGLLSNGADVLKSLGQDLARKSRVSEVEGERIARQLKARSSKAAKHIRRALDAEVSKVASAIHASIGEDAGIKKTTKRASAKSTGKPQRRGRKSDD